MKSFDVKKGALLIRSNWKPLIDVLQDLLNMDPHLDKSSLMGQSKLLSQQYLQNCFFPVLNDVPVD